MSNRVLAILQQIKELPEAELQELQAELYRLEEKELERLTAEARLKAKAEGIDDEVIARGRDAIHRWQETTEDRLKI